MLMMQITTKIKFRHILAPAWWLLVICVLGISAYAHWRAGYSFPNPEEDEPWYLWTSVELCDTGHWASPSLRPESPEILSPLFAVVNALLFKVFGVSLAVARWFSWTCMALAFLALLDMVRHRPWPWFSLFVLSLFYLGPGSVVAGNMVRPEAMIWMLLTWGFALLDRGKIGQGLLLVALTINLHTFGIGFFVGALSMVVLQVFVFNQHPSQWSKGEIVWLILAAIVGVSLLSKMIACFNLNVYFSAADEDSTSVVDRLRYCNCWFWLGGGGLAWLYCAFRKQACLCFLSLALLALLPMVLRAQLWYAVYQQMGYGMLLLVLLWVVADCLYKPSPRLASLSAVVVAAGMLGCAYQRYGWIPNMWNYPDKLKWAPTIRFADTPFAIEKSPPQYLTQEDRDAILAEIVKHLDGRPRPVRVFFCPEADGLFFHGLMPDGVIPYQGVRTKVPGDISIFRKTRFPSEWRKSSNNRRLSYCGGTDLPPFHVRDETESWIFVDGAPPPR